jgi:hypothetical protein
MRRYLQLLLLFITLPCGSEFVFGQASASLHSGAIPQNHKAERLEGRVIAGVNSLISGSGVGPKYETFIFELARHNGSRPSSGKLVRVVYAYFDREHELGRGFYNYQIFYQLRVFREPTCDAKVSEFAYEQNGDSEPPTSILTVLEGADRSLIDESQTLPCYVLNQSDYKKVGVIPEQIQ